MIGTELLFLLSSLAPLEGVVTAPETFLFIGDETVRDSTFLLWFLLGMGVVGLLATNFFFVGVADFAEVGVTAFFVVFFDPVGEVLPEEGGLFVVFLLLTEVLLGTWGGESGGSVLGGGGGGGLVLSELLVVFEVSNCDFRAWMLFVENVRVAACLGWVEAAAGEAAEVLAKGELAFCSKIEIRSLMPFLTLGEEFMVSNFTISLL
jgi:hypothetical protein